MARSDVVIGGDPSELVRACQKVASEYDKLIAKLTSQNAKLQAQIKQGMRESNEESFGAKALGMIERYAGAIGAIGLVVAGVRATLSEMNAQAARASEGIKRTATGIGALIGAGLSGKALQIAKEEAQITAVSTGMPYEQALELQKTLVTSGMGAERARFAGLYKIADVGALVKSVAGMRAATGLEPGRLLDMLLAGATRGKAEPEQLGTGLAGAMGRAGLAGVSPEEMIAGAALVSRTTLRPHMAGGEIGALAEGFQKMGLRGGLGAGIEEIARRGIAPRALERRLGLAYETYSILARNLPELAETRAAVGGAEGLAGRMATEAAAEPELGPVLRNEAAREAQAIQEITLRGPQMVHREEKLADIRRAAAAHGGLRGAYLGLRAYVTEKLPLSLSGLERDPAFELERTMTQIGNSSIDDMAEKIGECVLKGARAGVRGHFTLGHPAGDPGDRGREDFF